MKETVILLHGMGRSRLSMALLAFGIRRRGFRTVNIDYPSTRKSIETLSEEYLAPAITACKEQGAAKIHIVPHSLGGIIARQYLQDHSLPEGSRIVMLSPPNKGSEVTDAFRNSLLYK
ncbi:MAG: alpha/beta fold hydrolase, partial [Halobacteria archaeon]|nr:alpha/beta fold hydrolase [Halobacteria archaeon]